MLLVAEILRTWDVKALVNKWGKLPTSSVQDFSHQHYHQIYLCSYTNVFFAIPADLIVNVVQQGKPSNVGVIKVGDVFHFYSIQLVYVYL